MLQPRTQVLKWKKETALLLAVDDGGKQGYRKVGVIPYPIADCENCRVTFFRSPEMDVTTADIYNIGVVENIAIGERGLVCMDFEQALCILAFFGQADVKHKGEYTTIGIKYADRRTQH